LNNPETKLAPLFDLFKPDPVAASLAPLLDLRIVLLDAIKFAPLGILWILSVAVAVSLGMVTQAM
jgi:hypothetical protein